MDARKFLSDYSNRLEVYIKRYFDREKKKALKVDPTAYEALDILENYIKGGKKARPALTNLGYQIAGGVSADWRIKKILPAAFAVEIIHAGIIIQDDFIDKDELRRGKSTIHVRYSKRGGWHFGGSMAICVSDVAFFVGMQLLADCGLEAERVVGAIKVLSKFLVNTGYGQIMDLSFDLQKEVSMREVFKVRIFKTAHYTFVMPLVVGAILGGGNKKLLDTLEKYGEPVGLAFQIRDDVLGVFGDPKETGKSADSDIREGKKTLLYLGAMKIVKGEEKKFLKEKYGDKNIKPGEIKRLRTIIRSSGALELSDRLARNYIEKAKKYIPKITSDPDFSHTLISLADYMVEREK